MEREPHNSHMPKGKRARTKLPQLLFIGWEKLHELCFTLAQKLAHNNFDCIVSISRGGHVVSRIMADFLNLPLLNFSIQSYAGLEQKEVKITQKLGRTLQGKKVLLIDEIVDSGRTLALALKYTKRLKPLSLVSAAPVVKPHAHPRPDELVLETPVWVIFPYEVRETIESLLPLWEISGKTTQDLRRELIEGGMEATYVDFFLPGERDAAAARKSTNRP